MGKSITLYMDIVSPFAYIAYWLTRNSCAFSSVQIKYVPILLGGIMQSTGNTPPINIKNKDKWIGQERIRWTKTFGVPMSESMPEPFPQPTVNAQRALCYLYNKSQEDLIKGIDALYEAFWVKSRKINDMGTIEEALKTKFSEAEVKEILKGMKGDEAKKTLRDNSDEALKEGCFGLPWFVAENEKGQKEGFWGVDHIGQVMEFLDVKLESEGGRYKSML
ncbi:hypothetical protein AC579_5644 [Pseudocercospora musae]|uniref:Glutathione S-transferase kappa n=1 Tax=Pseudocercospora musae TaxID=113226 RepID=A0A139IEE4_9PEZI|nr:hypothetical protein AC579_5644 [Pseudocercospora musae]